MLASREGLVHAPALPIRPLPARRFAPAFFALAAALGGCAGPAATTRQPTPNPGGGYTTTAVGDWDDVEAAVLIGASKAEMAVLGDSTTGSRRVFRLITVTDAPAELIAQTADPAARGPVPITLTAHVGRFGDPARERSLVTAVARRLKDLAGVDYRPLD